MARDDKTPAARTRRVRSRDDSMLLRSAESLGRIIGRLQRQLDVLTRKVSRGSGVATPRSGSSTRDKSPARARASAARAYAPEKRSSGTASRKTKTTRSRKTAARKRGKKKTGR